MSTYLCCLVGLHEIICLAYCITLTPNEEKGKEKKKGKLTFRNTVEQSLWMALYKFLNDVYAVSFSGRAVKEHVGDVLCFSDCIKDQKI